jgi:hypothetical protein
MQNANGISRVAMFPAESITGPGRQPVTITLDADAYGRPDPLAVGGLRCRWRAATDGTLRMEWRNPSSELAW